MPRKARQQSSLHIHHIILRGINQQIIFEDVYDYLEFINIMKFYKQSCNFKLYAYYLMNNHVHLLLEESTVPLDIIMKRIEVKFVRWYNCKYQRIGHLFQDRYKSEPVNDVEYFLTVFRYIHQNPLHAKLERRLGKYPWSSYYDYVNQDISFVDVNTVLRLFPNHSACLDFLCKNAPEKCLEHNSGNRLLDTEALKIIRAETSCLSPSDFQHLDLLTRNKYIKHLSKLGLSIRQISRLTGTPRAAVTKAVKQ